MGGTGANPKRYEIRPYDPEHLTQVVREGVLEPLWGTDRERNHAYFKWKYHDNPTTPSPLGIVAWHQRSVVGFRGFFATRWVVGGTSDRVVVLSPGDTCVDPEHRRQGLSVAMGESAMDTLCRDYRVMLNLSAGRNSVPGYLGMGFMPLASKFYWTRDSLLTLMRLGVGRKARSGNNEQPFTTDLPDDVKVSNRARPEDMCEAIARTTISNTLHLVRDEPYLRWRFENPQQRYRIYIAGRSPRVRGYVVLRLSTQTSRGFVVDVAVKDETTLEELLRAVIRTNEVDILSVADYAVTEAMAPVLAAVGFRSTSATRFLERRRFGEWPLLVRPVKKSYEERDCLIGGLDIRRRETWSIQEICSDGA